ncbi:OmpA family protein [Flavobacterium rhizosphaerae]|uniref:OmpA family protein n=1 Tax=Flavobacterium rhizosphaerae TaxID=3163298 RepID=A0ABW8YVN3_9FLAO
MKNTYLTFIFLISGLYSTMAQDKNTAAADKLYARFEYVDAARAYLDVKDKTPYVYKMLGDSYYNVFNSKEAAKWYAQAVKTTQDAETYYRYAQMLKAEGRYEEANKQMQAFAKLVPKDQRAVIFNQDPNYLPKLKSQTKLFDEKKLDINDKKYGSFGGVLNDNNTFYFTSTRNTSRRTYGRNEEPYLDLYTAEYNPATGKFTEPVPIEELNTRHHDGPATVTGDGNTMYFASESFREGDSERGRGDRKSLIYLYKATKKDGKWGDVKVLPFNGTSYSTGNPAVTKDGKTLYFASNRKGSVGATDIWKVDVLGPDNYSEPVNLGKKINTEGFENNPYITDDNILYFASNGHKGFGGLDIFFTDLNQDDGEIVNVGLPINSPQDDFAFSFNVEKNIGFFSSGKDGNDNLYMAIPVCGVNANITVTDAKTGKTIIDASVAIADDKQNVIETKTTNDKGTVKYDVDCNRFYTLQVTADGYLANTASFSGKGGNHEVTVVLQPVENIIVDGKVMLNNIYFEYNQSFITAEAAKELDKLVQAMKSRPRMVINIKAHTDTRGSEEYNLKLSDDRARATMQYVLSKGISKERISSKGYGETEPLIDCGENCTDEEHAKNRRIEFIIVSGL